MKSVFLKTAVLALFVVLFTCVSVHSDENNISYSSSNGIFEISNGMLTVAYDETSQTFSIAKGDNPFLNQGRLFERQGSGKARIVKNYDQFGVGYAIEIIDLSGRVETLAVYQDLPFVFCQTSLANKYQDTAVVESVAVFSGNLKFDYPQYAVRAFGCEGVQSIDEKRSSYSFLAVAHTETRNAMVCGYISHTRGSGIVFSEMNDDGISIKAETQYGKLRIEPDSFCHGEIFVIGLFDDGLDGLEAYADAIATFYNIELPPVPSGYCTWYHARASDEKRTAELAKYCEDNLADYGFDFIQIDDFWQISTKSERRDFTTHKPDGPYPSGMKQTADNITNSGFTAGLWLIPFAWDYECPALAEHPDWFIKNKDNEINKVNWAGYCLDNTNPATRKFIRETISRITNDWGYKYLKLDGLWSGMGTKTLYPSPDYRPDRLGEAILHDPSKTQIEAYRMGLDNVRDAAGDDVFLLGCNIAQNMRTMGASFGLVDGMRVGRDIGAAWDKIVPCAALGSNLYFYHGRVWYNDPDCLMLRDPLTLDQARAWGSMIGITGQMNVVSEWLPDLPDQKLDVLKRTLPNHKGAARPIDLFENEIPQVWHLTIGEGNLKREIVGLFNWDEDYTDTVSIYLKKLGLEGDYVGFDFWENQYIEPFSTSKEFKLRPTSCRIIALQLVQDEPQVISTSRHITQGGIDLQEVNWDADNKVLSGVSQVMGGEVYELRIAVPGNEEWEIKEITASTSDRTASVITPTDELRALIYNEKTGEMKWSIQF